MKKTLATLTLVAAMATASAQMVERHNNIQFNLGGGVHTLLYDPLSGQHNLGLGGLFEAQYQYMITPHWGIGAGVQVSSLRSSATYSYILEQPGMALPAACYDADVTTRFRGWRERQDVVNLSIPVQLIFRAPINVRTAFQMGLGATLDHAVLSRYKTVSGTYNRQAYMPATNVTYTDMPTHGLGTFRPNEQGDVQLNGLSVGLLADIGMYINLNKAAGLYIGVYGNYAPAQVTPEHVSPALFTYDGLAFNYQSTFASDRVSAANPLEAGIKIGLRFGCGKEFGWREREAAEAAALAQAHADSIAAAAAAEAARLEAERRALEEATARAKAEAEARAKAQADSIAAVHAAELARVQAEARAQAEAAAQAQAQADRLAAEKAEAEARAKAEAERLAAEKAEAEARAQAEAEARAKAEAEARAKARAEQKAREEAAFVAGFTDTAFFETGKDLPIFGQLNEDSWDNLKDIMDRHPEIRVTVTGHTDNVGKASSNQALSQRRAENIKKMLMDKGISSDRISAVGMGQTQPIAPNTTPDGRARNRRIVITIGK